MARTIWVSATLTPSDSLHMHILPGAEPSAVSECDHGLTTADKSGLVTQFSTALQKRNIRMLYSSTVHTANILVEARDVDAAQDVLRPARGRQVKVST